MMLLIYADAMQRFSDLSPFRRAATDNMKRLKYEYRGSRLERRKFYDYSGVNFLKFGAQMQFHLRTAVSLLTLVSAGCGKSSATVVTLLDLLSPNTSTYQPYNPLIQGGNLAAADAVNKTGLFYNKYAIAVDTEYGVGNAISCDPNDILSEQALITSRLSDNPVQLLLGPPYWCDIPAGTQNFCTANDYLCISLTADQVRNSPNYTHSFTTAGLSPDWDQDVAYEAAAGGAKNLVFVSYWDISFEIPLLEQFGLTVTHILVPSDDPNNWANEYTNPAAAAADTVCAQDPSNSTDPNCAKFPSVSQLAQQLADAKPQALIIDSSCSGDAKLATALASIYPAGNANTWIGDTCNWGDFISLTGNSAPLGMKKMETRFYDNTSQAWQDYLNQYKAWSNNQPTGSNWEENAYVGTLLGIYAVHALMTQQHATETTKLSGTALRTAMLAFTNNADPAATSYYVSDVANILKAISAGQSIHVQGMGLPFAFDPTYGDGDADGLKYQCCEVDSNGNSNGNPILTVVPYEQILAAQSAN